MPGVCARLDFLLVVFPCCVAVCLVFGGESTHNDRPAAIGRGLSRSPETLGEAPA